MLPFPWGVDSAEDDGSGEASSYVTYEYAVDPEAIPKNLDAEYLSVLRHAEEGWTQSGVNERTVNGEKSVTLPGFGPFAVVASEPESVDVVSADLGADWVLAGHQITVQVELRNDGDRSTTRTIPVEVDDRTVTEHEMTIEPGERTTVPIQFEPQESGIVSVDGTEAGMLETGEPGEEPDDAASMTADETPEFVRIPTLRPVPSTVLNPHHPRQRGSRAGRDVDVH